MGNENRGIELSSRNVIDPYKDLETEDIRAILKDKAFPFAVYMQHIQADYNISTLTRNANAFGAEAVYYYGQRRIDKRGMVGTNHYTDVIYLKTKEELEALTGQYCFVGVDNVDGAVPIDEYEWPDEPVLFLFGEEKAGLVDFAKDLCQDLIYIPQYGSVRSLNVGCASAIVLHRYTQQFLEKQNTVSRKIKKFIGGLVNG